MQKFDNEPGAPRRGHQVISHRVRSKLAGRAPIVAAATIGLLGLGLAGVSAVVSDGGPSTTTTAATASVDEQARAQSADRADRSERSAAATPPAAAAPQAAAKPKAAPATKAAPAPKATTKKATAEAQGDRRQEAGELGQPDAGRRDHLLLRPALGRAARRPRPRRAGGHPDPRRRRAAP